jgi:hypothetical protein
MILKNVQYFLPLPKGEIKRGFYRNAEIMLFY